MLRFSMWRAVAACAAFLPPTTVVAAEENSDQNRPDVLSEGSGLAAKYPGDVGIARDPSVLFAEGFETGSLEQISRRWGEISNKQGKVMALSPQVSSASGGKRSLQMTATLGENTGGHLYKRLPRGVEAAFARFYVKFAPQAEYIHHFVHLGGYNPPTRWPQGGAGTRPRGDERVTVGIEPVGDYGRQPAPGIWNFYCYWHEMKISADGRYWGNGLRPARPALVPKGRWQCVEIMLKLNSTPDRPDGQLALWLDGKLVANFTKGVRRGRWSGMGFSLLQQGGDPFEGFRWRTSNELKINFFWLLHYVTENAARQNKVADPNRVNRVWFDDIVVATEYIGPIASDGTQGTTTQRRSAAASGRSQITFVSNEVADKPGIPGMLFNERFDDARLLSRGWYDGSSFNISADDAWAGKGCVVYPWKKGGTKPTGSSGIRHLFEPTEEVYLRYYIKLSPGWGWTNRRYHPHLVHFLTSENGKYHGPAASHLTLYVEPVGGKLRLAATDIQNKDSPRGLTQGPLRGGYNGKLYDSKKVLFDDSKWHCVEAMFKLNSLDMKGDRPNADGQLRGWFDGTLVVERTDVVFRSTDFPNMKINQFLLAPYFGPGLLPHPQTLWIDELAVGTKRIGRVNRIDLKTQ